MLSLHAPDTATAAAAFQLAPVMLARRTAATTRKYGLELQAKVRANASGRSGVTYTPVGGGTPGEIGPRVQTGDYRRSIRLSVRGAGVGGEDVAEVFTNSPQGRRLERGFLGLTDSLGRTFHQPPYPHFNPALDDVGPRYARALEADYVEIETSFLAGSRPVA